MQQIRTFTLLQLPPTLWVVTFFSCGITLVLLWIIRYNVERSHHRRSTNRFRDQSDIFTRIAPEIHANTLKELNIAEVLAFGASSRSHQVIASNQIMRTVNHLILSFGIEPSDMFKLLHATRGVLAGPAVLLAILPWSFEPSYLEVYVPKSQGEYASRVIQDIFGFKFNKLAGPYPDDNPIHKVVWLLKGAANVKIISSSTESALFPIFHLYTTLLMNFISSAGILCAYPGLTLRRRGLINSSAYGFEGYTEIMEKRVEIFRTRGFILSTTLRSLGILEEHICTRDPSCPHTIRSLYDSGTLFYKFQLDTLVQEPSYLRIFGSTFTPIWCMGSNPCNNDDPSIGWFTASSDAIQPFPVVIESSFS